MKKKLQQWAALCLTLALAFCLALPVWAENLENATSTLTITGLESGVTVNAYKIMSVNWHSNTDGSYQAPEDPTYKWNDSVAIWLKGSTNDPYKTYIDESNNVTSAFTGLNADSEKTFYTDLAVEISKSESDITITPDTLTLNETTATKDLMMGGYLVLVSDGTKIYSPLFVTIVPNYTGESGWSMPATTSAAAKQQSLTFKKEIQKDNTWVESDTVGIGKQVTFRLTADVPAYLENAVDKTFNISDNLPSSMELGENPAFTVRGYTDESHTYTGGADIPTDDYSKAETPAHDAAFTLEFDYEKIKTYKYITVQYTVTMNENTIVYAGNEAANGNTNTAYLDYVKNQLTGATDALQDTATVYSYGIKVNKEDKLGTALSGAEFKLYKTNTNGDQEENAIKFVEGTTGGTYRVATAAESATATATDTLVVAADVTNKGELTLSGLDVGIYYLTETKAPGGYNKLSAPILVEIKDLKNGIADAESKGPNGKPEYIPTTPSAAETEADDGYVPLTVVNSQGFTLPSTGGMGTVLFTTIGIVLMGGGLVLLLLYLRRRNRAE